MPPGLTVEQFFGFLVVTIGEPAAKAWWEWFTVSFPDWGREGWGRIDAARASCGLTPPSGPP